MNEKELTDEQYDSIMECLETGDKYTHREVFPKAIESYLKGIEITPSPKTDWETSLHLYTALGDAYFNLGKYNEANNSYNFALKCPDSLGNAYLWLGLGQSYFELENKAKAKEALMSAYMLEGEDIFDGEDEKYLNLIKPLIGQERVPENQDTSLFISEKSNSQEVYKTFKGKQYTKEQWEAFEKEQWEKYKGKK